MHAVRAAPGPGVRRHACCLLLRCQARHLQQQQQLCGGGLASCTRCAEYVMFCFAPVLPLLVAGGAAAAGREPRLCAAVPRGRVPHAALPAAAPAVRPRRAGRRPVQRPWGSGGGHWRAASHRCLGRSHCGSGVRALAPLPPCTAAPAATAAAQGVPGGAAACHGPPQHQHQPGAPAPGPACGRSAGGSGKRFALLAGCAGTLAVQAVYCLPAQPGSMHITCALLRVHLHCALDPSSSCSP